YFNKFNRYQTVGAYNSKESPYYPWYTFYDYPESYEAWWGIDTLPNVKENNSQYTEYICGDDGVLDYWISLGAAGYRLDVADELPDEFLDNLNKCVKKHGDEKIVIGEVWEDASNKESYGVKRRYLLGSQLDSVMNYPFKQAVLDYVKGGDPKQFRDRIMTIVENYPKPSTDVLMNFVSTHDVERAINNLGGENCDNKSKDWQAERYLTPEQYQKGKNMLKCAMALIYFLPGVPSIYYGDEVGMQGYKDPFNRRCFPWENEDMDMLDFVKQLGVIRRSSKIFRDGSIKFLSLKDDVISFARIRKKNNKAVVIFINRSNRKQPIYSIPEFTEKYSDFRIIYGGEMCDNRMELEPYSYAVIKVEL
ncbi:MAG TPA: alpha-glycosidase, partial [Ruminococcus sp.]|nr:alpha-glycosidase [Ruminococcus sp.]